MCLDLHKKIIKVQEDHLTAKLTEAELEFPDQMEIDEFLAVINAANIVSYSDQESLGRRMTWTEEALRTLFDKVKVEEEDRF